MKNFLFVILYFFVCPFTNAQLFNVQSFGDTLYSKLNRIEVKLFDAVMHGKVIAYRNDSLTAVYTAEQIRQLCDAYIQFDITGGKIKVLDTTRKIIYDVSKDGKGLCGFYKPVKNSFQSLSLSFKLESVALLYDPYFANTTLTLGIQPLLYLMPEAVKKALTKVEWNYFQLISRLLLSDKSYDGFRQEVDSIKFSNNNFYSSGVQHELDMFSNLNNISMHALANHAYWQTIDIIRNQALKHSTAFYSDSLLLNKLSWDSLEMLTTVPKHKNQGVGIKQEYAPGDSMYRSLLLSKDYTAFSISESAIGICSSTYLGKTVYISRSIFETLCPPWLSQLITDN